jgi:alpha-tubulin suppressor-like RCC1 family protein
MQFTGITITGGSSALPTTNVPDAPTVGTATTTGANSATVAFTAPVSDGNSTIISYTAISTPSNITSTLVQSGSGTITVTGLVPSTSYTFKVYATNSLGNSAASSASNSITTSAPAINPLSWGINQYYQLALSDTVLRSSPTQIGSTGDWSTLAVGYRYTLATKNNGTLWAVGGRADNGGFGLGSGVGYVSSPIQVGALTTWNNVGVGYYTSTAIKTDGTLWSWGQFGSGPLNGGQTGLTSVASPVLVGSDTDWVDMFQTQSFGLGIKTDNSLWAWGDNTYGQLGTNSPISANSPMQVGNDTDWVNIGGGAYSALATRTDGTLWTWGNNSNGELGINSVILRSSPVQVGGLTNWYKIVKSSTGFFITQSSLFAIKTNGTLWGWGSNDVGSIGDNTVINRSSPVQIGTDTNWNNITTAGKALSSDSTQFTIANRTDGTLWSWGGNKTGELGQNNLVYRSSPVQVGSSTTWVNSVSSGENYAMALNGSKTPPNAPNILVAEAVSSTSVLVGVAAPIVTGTDGYVTYTATSSPGGFTGTLTNKYGGGGIIVNDLIPGISYTFTVTATNSVGTSAASSPSNSVIPVDVPNPVLNLYGWGRNIRGELGLNDILARSNPTQIGSNNNWNTLVESTFTSLMIKTDGTLWSTGYNLQGQLGQDNTVHRSSPVQIGNDNNWNNVSAGYFSSAAIKIDNTLWSWGINDEGQLGLGDLVHRSSPTQVGSSTDWNKIYVGYWYMAGLKTDGTLWTWGDGNSGMLGSNSRTSKSSPALVGSDTTWTDIAIVGNSTVTGYDSTIALKTNGTLWAWGNNNTGQLGLNDLANRSSPVQVGNDRWSAIAGGTSCFAAISADGKLYTWGGNSVGDLGLDDQIHRSSPTQVGSLTTWNMLGGGEDMCAIKTDGTLWAWGTNTYGLVGDNTRIHRSSPVQIGNDTNWLRVIGTANTSNRIAIKGTAAKPDAPTNVVATVTGISTVSVSFTRPLSDNGSDIFQYTVTSNPNNIKAYSSTYGPITVSNLNPQSTYTFTVIATNSVGDSLPSSTSNSITTNTPESSAYSFGNNDGGELGLNDQINRSSPVQVGSASTWNYLASGRGSILATKRTGTLWGWGSAAQGQLEVLKITRSSPVQIGALTNWSAISKGDNSSYGVKTDGTLWAWGFNDIGQLGINSIVNTSSPTLIGSDTNWIDVVAGGDFVFALKPNGTLWAWGNNARGELGQNNLISRSSPVQVGTDTNWSKIGTGAYNALAIKTDGTLWAWGNQSSYSGYYGVLGLNDIIDRSSPVQVGSLTNWASLGKGGYTNTTSFAIKTDGTLWAWGHSSLGRIGDNTKVSRSSPVQIGNDTNWISVASGNETAASGPASAIKSDGTLWTWGGPNTEGGLGLNDILPRSNPTQVGTDTNWIGSSISGFEGGTIAIQGTATVPTKPFIIVAEGTGGGNANITFTAPITDGGAPITSYTVTSSPGNVQYPLGITGTINRSNGGIITVSGLTNNVTYTFTVTATNSIGTSEPSSPSNSIIAQ